MTRATGKGTRMDDGTDRPKVIVKPRRERVLVVLHSDGWVEVFANRNVDVRIVNRLHCTQGNAAEVAMVLDQLVECELPKCYGTLYYPNKLRGFGQVRRITPQQKQASLVDVSLIRAVVQSWKDQCLEAKQPVEPAKSKEVA